MLLLFFFFLFHARAYDTRLYRMRRTAIIDKKNFFFKNDRRVKRTASRPSRASRGRSEISTGWAVCRQRKTRANHGRGALERIVRGTRTCPVLIFHPGKTKADVTRKQGKHIRWKRGRRPET